MLAMLFLALFSPVASAFAQEDSARAAVDILTAKCASCHGPDTKEPKALRAWNGPSDLAASVLDSDFISPGDPDDSTIFIVIDDGEMPPSRSDIPPLTEEESAIVRDWITAGAPLPAPAPETPSEEAQTGEAQTGETQAGGALPAGAGDDSGSRSKRAGAPKDSWLKKPLPRWLGHFHPLILHFPIALFSVAFLAEALARLLKKYQLQLTATFCLTLGALSSAPTAALGWLLAASTSHSGSDILYHRWLGVSVAVLSLLALKPFYSNPKLRLPILVLLAALVGVTGHLGGSLSYGSEWLDWPKK